MLGELLLLDLLNFRVLECVVNQVFLGQDDDRLDHLRDHVSEVGFKFTCVQLRPKYAHDAFFRRLFLFLVWVTENSFARLERNSAAFF